MVSHATALHPRSVRSAIRNGVKFICIINNLPLHAGHTNLFRGLHDLHQANFVWHVHVVDPLRRCFRMLDFLRVYRRFRNTEGWAGSGRITLIVPVLHDERVQFFQSHQHPVYTKYTRLYRGALFQLYAILYECI